MVGIYSGSNQIKNVYAGSQLIKKVYYGSTLVYEIMAKGTKVLNKTTAGTGSFTVTVPGIYRLRVVGGGSGCSLMTNFRISAGGGGGYAYGQWQLSAGDVLTWKVGGAAGVVYTGPGDAGGQSYIKKGSTTLVSANGGTAPGYAANGDHGNGGTASVHSSAISGSGKATTGGAGKYGKYSTKDAALAGYAGLAGKSAQGTYGKGASACPYSTSDYSPSTATISAATAGCVIVEWYE